jgi:hypothetical protein
MFKISIGLGLCISPISQQAKAGCVWRLFLTYIEIVIRRHNPALGLFATQNAAVSIVAIPRIYFGSMRWMSKCLHYLCVHEQNQQRYEIYDLFALELRLSAIRLIFLI